MKHLAIIFCVFLSVSAELSTQKLFSAFIRYESEYETASEVDCYLKKVEAFDVVMSEEELREGTRIAQKLKKLKNSLFFKLNTAYGTVIDICRYGDESSREKMEEVFLREIPDSPEDLECVKSYLKQVKPDHELVKDFKIDPNCETDDDQVQSQLKYLRESYEQMEITKCSYNEYAKARSPDFLIKSKTEAILMIKILKKPLKEVFGHVLNEILEANRDRLKCLLDEIYDR
jgi:hypothetical protein